MNRYITAAAIKELREKAGITQAELGQRLSVSDRTVSKWETGKGYPDITLLEPLSAALKVSVAELLSGNCVQNTNISRKLTRANFYVCPVCGNTIWSIGSSAVSCHGIMLPPLSAEECDERHILKTEDVEDEYFVTCLHPMTKEHYITFMAAVGYDRIQFVSLYPQGNAEARFKRSLTEEIYFYCNKDGLYKIKM